MEYFMDTWIWLDTIYDGHIVQVIWPAKEQYLAFSLHQSIAVNQDLFLIRSFNLQYIEHSLYARHDSMLWDTRKNR